MAAIAYIEELFVSFAGVPKEINTLLSINNNIIVFMHLCSFLILQKCTVLHKDVIKNSEWLIKNL
jgi:uncharacterized protein YhhL (DUF1145 family)